MSASRSLGSRFVLSLTLVAVVGLAATGCERDPPEEMVQEMEELRAERDQLREQTREMDETQALLQELRTELEALELPETLVDEDDPPLQTRADTLRALVRVTGRSLEEARGELQSARARAATFQRRADSLRTVHDEAVAEHEARLAREEARIGELEGVVNDLEARVATLEGELEESRDAYQELNRDAHRAYWIADTRETLRQQGVVREEGGARVLLGILWRRGETLVPGRDLDPAQFNAIDLREEQELALPRPDRRYRVVSRHDEALLEGTRVNGALTGATVRITDPERFWRASPFLILVEQES